MKLKITAVLVLINYIFNPLFCYANSDDFDYGINKTTDVNFNNTIIIEDDSGQPGNLTTYDYVPFLNNSIIVPVKKNLSALMRTFCNMYSGGYDFARTILETYCGNNSNYSLTVTAVNDSLTVDSINGSTIVSIPEGEFSAYINNNDNTDLSCNTYLMGIGSDTTPEEGFNINLTCYDKLPDGQRTNVLFIIGFIMGTITIGATHSCCSCCCKEI